MQNRIIIVSDDKYKAFQRYERMSKLNRSLAIFTLLMFGIFVANVVLLVEDSPSWSGKYTIGLDWIVLKGYDSPGYMLETARHEIGHHVYFVSMNSTQRDDWVFLHDKSTSSDYVSTYAKTNSAEDFAETFMKVTEEPNVCFVYSEDDLPQGTILTQKLNYMCKVYVDVETHTK